MLELFNNKIGVLVSSITLLVTIVGTSYAVDQRYMKVSDYEAAQQRYEVRQLEDKLFELEFKIANDAHAAKPIDKALKERYRERLEALRK